MIYKTYKDVEIDVIRSTQDPDQVIRLALDTTMKQGRRIAPNNTQTRKMRTLMFLIKAGHTSVLEHVNYTFHIRGVSRSFLAQITRHRMSSFTASSQHYQDYRDYPVVVGETLAKSRGKYVIAQAYNMYTKMVDSGHLPHWEARQVLPNAAACDIIWTINARSLVHFLNIRLCKRNVPEMVHFAKALRRKVRPLWKALFLKVHADCVMHKECKQGYMSCGEPYGNDKNLQVD